jgi:prepilin-type processing-associated H-X9-DG protein
MYRRAFTLLELLLVISIIMVLAAMLFPVVNRVRENGRRTSCQSNLKQIGMGISQYIQDNNEKYPIAYNSKSNWSQATFPYIKSTQVFECPNNNYHDLMLPHDTAAPEIPLSYAINPRFSHLSTANVSTPLRKINIGECYYALPFMADNEWGSTWPRGWQLEAAAAHLSTANCLFADGHVKALRLEATMTPLNMWGGFDTPDGSCQPGDINCDVPDADALKFIGQRS